MVFFNDTFDPGRFSSATQISHSVQRLTVMIYLHIKIMCSVASASFDYRSGVQVIWPNAVKKYTAFLSQ